MTIFTLSSVHRALKTVATTRSSGVPQFKKDLGGSYSFSNSLITKSTENTAETFYRATALLRYWNVNQTVSLPISNHVYSGSMLPTLTAFDVETTGLDPLRGHRIIEIAAFRIEGGKILRDKPFHEFVNPERPIPVEAGHVNKIRDEDVKDAPLIDQVLPRFLEYAAGSFLVAHNAEFDMGFLRSEKEYCWGFIDLPEHFCTMRLSQSIFPREFRHNLDVVCRRLSLEQPPAGRHRALPDALLTAQAMLRMLEIGGVNSLEELRKRAGVKQLVR